MGGEYDFERKGKGKGEGELEGMYGGMVKKGSMRVKGVVRDI